LIPDARWWCHVSVATASSQLLPAAVEIEQRDTASDALHMCDQLAQDAASTHMTTAACVLKHPCPIMVLDRCPVRWPHPLTCLQEPHYNHWVNHVRASLYGMVFWAALMLIILTFSERSGELGFKAVMTNIMLIGLLPAVLISGAISYQRLRWRTTAILAAFR
jgi:hypothetical protein